METKQHEKTLSNILFVIIIGLMLLWTGTFVYSTSAKHKLRAELNQARGLYDGVREQLNDATATVRDIAAEIQQCYFICADLREENGRSITNIREAIDCLEETRYEVALLEKHLHIIDPSELYYRVDYWDDYLREENKDGNKE